VIRPKHTSCSVGLVDMTLGSQPRKEGFDPPTEYMANKIKKFDNVARLGRHVNHDPRSRQFVFDGSNVALKTVRHSRYIPVLDQGNLGSCTGNAATGALGTGNFFGTLPAGLLLSQDSNVDEQFAVQLYSDATKADPYPGDYPPEDTGSDGLSVAKVLKARGLISGYTHTFSLDDALSALSTQPVIIGINWYESMFDPDGNGLVTISPKSPVAGGHEIVLDEINVEQKLVGSTNSWGTGWGVNGRFYLSFDTFGRLLGEDGDCTVFVPVNKPAPVPVPVPVDDALANYPSAEVDPWMNSPHWWHKATVASRALKAWKAKYGIA
jgi:hypothetical protein